MILNLVIKILLYCCAIATLVTFLPGSILLDIKPRGFKVHAPKNLDAYRPLDLVKVSQFSQQTIVGPESIAVFQDRAVSGSADGYLYEVISDKESGDIEVKQLIRVINDPGCAAKFGAFSSLCGHPLGIKFDSKGVLFVVEPSRGVYRVDGIFTPSPKVSLVLDIAATGSKFLDDIAIQERPSGKHVLYLTDVSVNFRLEEAMLAIFASDKGRVLAYDMESKKVSTVVDSLFFPNGIEVTPENDALFFVEFANRSLHKVPLSGPSKGKDQAIMLNLPAEIDNIRLSASGKTLWLAMLRPTTLFTPSEMDYYLKKPLLRKLIARSSYLVGATIENINKYLLGGKNEYLREMGANIRTMSWLFPVVIDHRGGMAIEVDFNGKVVSSFYSQNDTRLGELSEVRELKSDNDKERVLLLGSYSAGYLRRMVIQK